MKFTNIRSLLKCEDWSVLFYKLWLVSLISIKYIFDKRSNFMYKLISKEILCINLKLGKSNTCSITNWSNKDLIKTSVCRDWTFFRYLDKNKLKKFNWLFSKIWFGIYHPTENIRQVTLRREKLLGFKLASIRNANERCHKVKEVTRNLPADLAGLKPGDIILKRITNVHIFSSFIISEVQKYLVISIQGNKWNQYWSRISKTSSGKDKKVSSLDTYGC